MKLTAHLAIKQELLWIEAQYTDNDMPSNIPSLALDEIYDAYEDFVETGGHYDGENDFRCGGEETNIDPAYSGHFESESHAIELQSGRWVGWTYFYGGGKHANPEDVDWMEYAYFLNCTEEQKLITVRTFEKLD